MCAGAALQARLKRLVYGAPNPLSGAAGSWVQLLPRSEDAAAEGDGAEAAPARPPPRHAFHPDLQVRGGVLAEDAAELMRAFFRERRAGSRGRRRGG